MQTKFRYLNASLLSFMIHAAIVIYFYLTISFQTSTNLLTKPVYVDISFELPEESMPSENQKTEISQIDSENLLDDLPTSLNINELSKLSNIPELIKEENIKSELDNDQVVAFFAQRVITEIENAWIRPKNISNLLNCDLKIQIDRNGQIIKSELVKSSGNFRFDNSSLTAVTRVDRFSFYNEISDDQYINNFKIIFLNFNPYE